jgi:pimeloyl-ACP methyl ester carboxylesterase
MLPALFAKTFWWKILIYAAAAYLFLCLLVYLGQRRLIYLPSRNLYPFPERFVEWRSPDRSEYWGCKRISGARECLFFFHGNGGNASGWSHAAADFPGDIFVLEYPGYGPRNGSPTERTLKAAALRAFEAEHPRYDRVIVAGQSLGAAITEPIFSKFPGRIYRLVLITPFTSISDVARAHFPWLPTRWMLHDTMHLFERWQKFGGKTCVVLAGQDEIVPRSHSLRYLEAKSATSEIIELPDERHNTIQLTKEFWEKTLSADRSSQGEPNASIQ